MNGKWNAYILLIVFLGRLNLSAKETVVLDCYSSQ